VSRCDNGSPPLLVQGGQRLKEQLPNLIAAVNSMCMTTSVKNARDMLLDIRVPALA